MRITEGSVPALPFLFDQTEDHAELRIRPDKVCALIEAGARVAGKVPRPPATRRRPATTAPVTMRLSRRGRVGRGRRRREMVEFIARPQCRGANRSVALILIGRGDYETRGVGCGGQRGCARPPDYMIACSAPEYLGDGQKLRQDVRLTHCSTIRILVTSIVIPGRRARRARIHIPEACFTDSGPSPSAIPMTSNGARVSTRTLYGARPGRRVGQLAAFSFQSFDHGVTGAAPRRHRPGSRSTCS